MQTLQLCIALGPLAVYLFLVGLINSRRRPFLTSGARDMAVLGIALSGFFIIGPLQLFVPDTAADRFGPYIWLVGVFSGKRAARTRDTSLPDRLMTQEKWTLLAHPDMFGGEYN